MTYCSNTPKATITYKFGSGIEKTYVTDKTPITVDTSDRYTPPFAGGQCPIRYWVEILHRFKFNNSPYGELTWLFSDKPNGVPIYGQILDIYFEYEIGELCGANNSVRGAKIVYRDYRTGKVASRSSTAKVRTPQSSPGHAFNDLWTNQGWEVVNIEPVQAQTDNCGDPQPVCTLKVLHNGQQIFIDRGDCPVTYSVTCGDECPPGTTKCFKSGYPGYCCLPCNEIKSEIKALASQIRSLTNG